MKKQRTLSIIKPDAVRKKVVGEIIGLYEGNGYGVIGLKRMRLDREVAGEFYREHRGKVFYESLVEYMISGPVIGLVLEGEEVISRHRELMGATDPKEAKEGTIRRKYGQSIESNGVHGSDSEDSADFEIGILFREEELIND